MPMNKHKLYEYPGFTLTEVLVGMVITGLVLLLGWQAYRFLEQSNQRYRSKADFALEWSTLESVLKDDLDEALYVKRNLGKIRCMRKTLHILSKEQIPVVYIATKRIVEKASRKYMEARVSLKECEEVSESILDTLKNNKMTTSELKKRLETNVDLSAILYYMCDQGLLIRDKPKRGWKNDCVKGTQAFQPLTLKGTRSGLAKNSKLSRIWVVRAISW